MTLYLSRLRLSRGPSVCALMALLEPEEAGRAADASHRLVWSAFAGDPGQKRDFLWRAEGRGLFFTLSSRPPVESAFFDGRDVREFAPDLRPGDRLDFTLRANATRTRKTPGDRGRGKRVDLVMDGLYPLPSGRVSDAREKARMDIAQARGAEWLAGQGAGNGFAPLRMDVASYAVLALPGHVGRRAGQPQFGIMEMAGTLEVTDPAAFLSGLAQGFGRAKAFGCGLMLIRRAGQGG